jgi:hypothetical protein
MWYNTTGKTATVSEGLRPEGLWHKSDSSSSTVSHTEVREPRNVSFYRDSQPIRSHPVTKLCGKLDISHPMSDLIQFLDFGIDSCATVRGVQLANFFPRKIVKPTELRYGGASTTCFSTLAGCPDQEKGSGAVRKIPCRIQSL